MVTSKKTNNVVRMIKETIQTKTDLKEIFSGSLDKIRQGLNDIESAFGDKYNYIEVQIEGIDNYDSTDIDIYLNGFRPETQEEAVIRLQKEEKIREKRLEQLAKDRKTLEKKRADLVRKQAEITKELAKIGVTP